MTNHAARHLSIEERGMIADALSQGMNFKETAAVISRHPSTVAREIARHRESVKKRLGFTGSRNSACVNFRHCSTRRLCKSCKQTKYCKHCIPRDCTKICKKYIEEACARVSKPPYVCNACNRKTSCRYEKFYYRAHSAHRTYLVSLMESRQGINLEPWELGELDDLVSPLIFRGQSIAHIYATHAHEIPCSKRTLYEYIGQGLLAAKNIDLPRKVRYKKRGKAPNTPCNYRHRQGRTYEDFVEYTGTHPFANITEMDTVEGKRGDEKVLLTIYLRPFHFMLIRLMEYQDMEGVLCEFINLEDILGLSMFREIFPVMLTDNGAEFKDPVALEEPFDLDGTDESGLPRTRIFYCDPGKSYQKGAIEKNHEFIRYVLPKGSSFENLTPEDCLLLTNHINSYTRNEKKPFTPFDLMERAYPEFVNKLGLKKIPPDEILLSPRLLKK